MNVFVCLFVCLFVCYSLSLIYLRSLPLYCLNLSCEMSSSLCVLHKSLDRGGRMYGLYFSSVTISTLTTTIVTSQSTVSFNSSVLP